MILIPQYRTARRATAAFTGALDSYTANLWALRWTARLLTSYTGALIRVRRSSDSAEADIGYTSSGALDTSALLAHCGTDIGYVTKIYDQSGNSRHLTQTTAAYQPRICNSGAMLGTVGSFYGVYFSGDLSALIYLVDSDPSALTVIELFGSVKNDADPSVSSGRTGHPFCYQDGNVPTASHYPWTDGIIYDKFCSNVRKTAGNPTNSMTTAHVYNCRAQTAASNGWDLWTANGHTYSVASNTLAYSAAPRVGMNNTTSAAQQYQYNGYIAGAIIYSADKSADRATIRGLLL